MKSEIDEQEEYCDKCIAGWLDIMAKTMRCSCVFERDGDFYERRNEAGTQTSTSDEKQSDKRGW